MNPHAYTENQLVERPAIGLFAALGWQTVSVMGETFGPSLPAPLPEGDGRIWLGRETKSEVVLLNRLRAALGKFNPTLPPEALGAAIDELTRDRSAMSLAAANREVYRLLKDGIPVSVPDREILTSGSSPKGQGGQTTERLRVIDWEHPENNDFLLVSQFSVTGALYTCRPDLVGFVNGLPWVVIELKKPGVPVRAAFDENLTHYQQHGSTRYSSPATAPIAASARSPPAGTASSSGSASTAGTASSSGSASSARTNRAACRWK